MPDVTAIYTNWTAGEISPRLYGRIDLEKYASGAHTISNFIVQRFGGVRKRGGTEYINEVKTSSTAVRLIPFVYSVTQAYILEFGDEYIRFYANGAVVESASVPVEVSSPYTEDDLADISFAQSADVLYLAHPDYAPRKLSRTSATSFTLEVIDFQDGPYLELNTTSTTLTPANYASLTPVMTSKTVPSGTVSSSPSDATDYRVFDKNKTTEYAQGSTNTGYIQYRTASSEQVVVDAYYITATRDGDQLNRSPVSWELKGSNDGSNFTTVDSRQNETAWSTGETRFFEFANKAAFEYWRFEWLGTDGASTASEFAELGLNRAPVSQTAFNLTASAVTGINGGSGFQASDVGRPIRLQASDGKWRWAKIQSVTSTTVVTIKLNGWALPNLEPILNWKLGAWCEETGWPAAVSFYEGRLCFARTAEQPETVWMSKVDDFEDHGVSDPLVDDDAISVSIRADSLNEIKWITEGAQLIVGTSAAMRTIGEATTSEPFSPTNIRQKRQSTFAAGDVAPAQVGNVVLYADYYRTALREFAYSFELNSYVAQDMSILAEHLLRNQIKEMAFAQNPDALLWVVDDSGNLRAVTYERDQNVVAFHKHTIGGTGVYVESVAAIPGNGRDEVWLLVRRTIDGGSVRYIERLSIGLSDTGDLEDATFLDSHLTYSGGSTTSLTGIDHLEGESVYVWSDAGKQGPYTVSSGAITLDEAVTVACVGLAYSSTLETLSPEVGARGGTAQTRLGTTKDVFIRLDRSVGGTCGPSDGTQETIEYDLSMDNEGSFGDGATLYTGDVRVPIEMKWERYKRIKVVHSDPTPFHMIAMIYEHRVSG